MKLLLLSSLAMAQPAPLPISIPLNAVRASHDVPQLASTSALDCAAKRHAEDMAKAGLCGNVGTDGSTMQERAEDCGTEAHGQLIACGYSDPAKVVQAWMRDYQSRRILLNPDHIAIGTAHVKKTWVVVVQTNF